MQAERLDGSVLLAGCDKSLPGHAHGRRAARPRQRLPLRRLDPARAGQAVDGTEKDVTIIDAFEAVGACARGLMSARGRRRASSARSARARAPAAACTPPTRWPASPRRSACRCPARPRRPPSTAAATASPARSGEAVVELLAPGHHGPRHHDQGGVRERDRRRHGARRLDQRRAAPARDRARGRGRARPSTTSTASAPKVPHLADVKPFGQYVMNDVDRVGGVPVVMKALLDAGLLHGDCLTVTGQDDGREPRRHRPAGPGRQRSCARSTTRSTRTGGITILRGSLAPEGAVVKTAGFDRRRLRGHRPRLRRRARRRWTPSRTARSQAGDVVVIRYEGPKGGPGMREMLADHRRDQGRRPRQGRPAASPTAGSPAARPACASATSRPRPSTAGRSRFVRDGDRIRLDVAEPHASTCWSTTTSWRARRGGWAPLPPALHPRRAGQVRASWSARPRAAPSATETVRHLGTARTPGSAIRRTSSPYRRLPLGATLGVCGERC